MKALLTALCLLLALSFRASADSVNIRFGVAGGITANPGLRQSVELFREKLAERLKGVANIITVGPNELPGDFLGHVFEGKIDLTAVSTAQLADKFDQKMGVFSLPFMFQGPEQAAAVQESYVGEGLLASISAKGLTALGYWNGEMTYLAGHRAFKSVHDFRGAKVATNSPGSTREALAALGISPVQISSADVYNGLQTGYVDTAELSLSSIALMSRGSKWYVSDVSVRPTVAVVVANEVFWAKQSQQVQSVLADVTREVMREVSWAQAKKEASELNALRSTIEVASFTSESRSGLLSNAEAAWRKQAVFRETGLVDSVREVLGAFSRTSSEPGKRRSERGSESVIVKVFFATDRFDHGVSRSHAIVSAASAAGSSMVRRQWK